MWQRHSRISGSPTILPLVKIKVFCLLISELLGFFAVIVKGSMTVPDDNLLLNCFGHILSFISYTASCKLVYRLCTHIVVIKTGLWLLS